MTRLALASLQVSALVLISLAAVAFMRRRSAALRHWLLAVALACAAVAPFVGSALPAWPVLQSALPAGPAVTTTTTVVETAPAAPDIAPQASERPAIGASAVTTIWLAGMGLSLAMLGAGALRLRTLISGAEPATGAWLAAVDAVRHTYGLRRPVRLLHVAHPTLLVAFGLRRHTVLLPAGSRHWSAERIHIVVGHELAHAARGDWGTHLLAELLRAVYWFNPLVWIACRRLRQESEYACDDEVLRLGVGGADYAEHLVALARDFRAHGPTWLPAPAMARPSTLRRRISAMLDAGLNRQPLTSLNRAFVIAALVACTLPIAGLAAQSAATLSGTIQDVNGGALTGATLRLSDAGGAVHEVKSDAAGRFAFVGVPPGDYQFDARSRGFATYREKVSVAAGQTLTRALSLELGALQETITVTSGPPSAPRPVTARPTKAAAPPCVPAATGGHIVPPTKVRDVRPIFPARLQQERSMASVSLQAVIGADGLVKDAYAVTAVDADVEAAAVDAVKQWVFTPTLLNCAPTEVKMMVSVTFRQN